MNKEYPTLYPTDNIVKINNPRTNLLKEEIIPNKSNKSNYILIILGIILILIGIYFSLD